MNLRKTALLGLVLAALAVYIYRIENPRITAEQEKSAPFSGLTRQAYDRVLIKRASEKFTLVNSSPETPSPETQQKQEPSAKVSAWGLLEVKGAQIDAAPLNGLLSALTELQLGKALPQAEVSSNLSDYGLAKPELAISVDYLDRDSQSRSAELQFGKENDYLNKRYLRVSESQGTANIFLVSAGLYTAANKPRDDFRKKYPLEFKDEDLQRVTLDHADEKIVLEPEKTAPGAYLVKWKIVEPLKVSASFSALQEIFRELRQMKVKTFLDQGEESVKRAGLNTPYGTITLTFKDELKRKPLEIALALPAVGSELEKEGAEFLKLSDLPTVFGLEKNTAATVFKSAAELREKQLASFPVYDAQSVEVSGASLPNLKLEKIKDDWKVNGKPADAPFVEELLNKISNLEAQSFPNQTRDFGFSHPRLKIVVKLRPGSQKQSLTLVVGDVAEGDEGHPKSYLVGVDDLSEPFIAAASDVKKLFPREEVLLKPEAAAHGSSVSSESAAPNLPDNGA